MKSLPLRFHPVLQRFFGYGESAKRTVSVRFVSGGNMRSFVDLGLFLAAVALGIGAVLPVVGGVRPTQIPMSGLWDGFASGDLSSIAQPGLPLYQSLAVPLAVAAVLLLLAALVDSVGPGWVGTVLAIVTAEAFWVQILSAHGEFVQENRRTALTNQNGTVLLLSGILVALLCCLVAVRRPPGTRSSFD